MKKLLTLGIVLFCLFLIPSAAADIVYISDQSGLEGMANNLSGEYELTQNIPLTGTWTPIGNTTESFTGTFNGAGFTISNLQISTASDYAGFFGKIHTGAVITNVTLENVDISGGAHVGSLVGGHSFNILDTNSTIIQNCHVIGGTVAGNGNYTGGLIGYAQRSDTNGSISVTNCSVSLTSVTASGDAYFTGGLAGYIFSETNAVVNCSAEVETVQGVYYVGGLAGSGRAFTDCHAEVGTVSGVSYVGGLFGGETGRVRDSSVAAGNIIGTGDYVGGLSGSLTGTKASDSYAAISGNVTGAEYVGGLAGYANDVENTLAVVAGKVSGTENVGGLIGSHTGSMINSAAVVSSIESEGTNVHRISGLASGTLSEVYTWEGTKVNDATVSGTSSDADGADAGTSELQSENFYSGITWDFTDKWMMSVDANYLFPVLQAKPDLIIDASFVESAPTDEYANCSIHFWIIDQWNTYPGYINATSDSVTVEEGTVVILNASVVNETKDLIEDLVPFTSNSEIISSNSSVVRMEDGENYGYADTIGTSVITARHFDSLLSANLTVIVVSNSSTPSQYRSVPSGGTAFVSEQITLASGYEGPLTKYSGDATPVILKTITFSNGHYNLLEASVGNDTGLYYQGAYGNATVNIQYPSMSLKGYIGDSYDSLSGKTVSNTTLLRFVIESQYVGATGLMNVSIYFTTPVSGKTSEFGGQSFADKALDGVQVPYPLVAAGNVSAGMYLAQAEFVDTDSMKFNGISDEYKKSKTLSFTVHRGSGWWSVVNDTVSEGNWSAATPAQAEYQVNLTQINNVTAPLISNKAGNILRLTNATGVAVLSDGGTRSVPVTVNPDGSVTVDGDLTGVQSVDITFNGRKQGDVTGNGNPNMLDALTVAQGSVGNVILDETQLFYGDVTGNGNPNMLDALTIAQYSVGNLNEQYE